MKKLIAGTAIIVFLCVMITWAAPEGIISTGSFSSKDDSGISDLHHDIHDVVPAVITIQNQRQDIQLDGKEPRQDNHQNLTNTQGDLQYQNRVIQNDTWQNNHENQTAGHEDGQNRSYILMTQINQSWVTLVKNVTELHSEIKTERQTMMADAGNLTNAQKQFQTHYINFWIATRALKEMRDLAGDNGTRIAEIADDINTTSSTIELLEKRINDRSAFVHFFFGGDRAAADQINTTVTQNDHRIQEMQQLIQNSSLQPDVRQEMQVQIAALQEEQDRLANLSATEYNSNGIFVWI